MEVIRAGVLGFCMGVRRAVDFAINETQTGSPVFSLGPLIHNPIALADLEVQGIKSVDSLDQLPSDRNCSVIIRAHGIEPNMEKALRASGVNFVDATCPNVKANQLKAEELSRLGYCLFLAGEAKHAEVEGILGYVKCSSNDAFCEITGNASDAGKAAKKLYSINSDVKTAILGQTTISEKEYLEISEAVRIFFPNLEVIQTICTATKERQEALNDLLHQVDAVIVAGGKNSANTRRLLYIAEESGKPCALVEDPLEIPDFFFTCEKVGLCAGASTPDSVIGMIEERLLTYSL